MGPALARELSPSEAAGIRAGRLRAFFRGPVSVVTLSVATTFFGACNGGPTEPELQELRLSGAALGTSWSLVLVDEGSDADPAALEALVTAALDEVDRSASTWRGDSELASVAALEPGEPLAISAHLLTVLDEARFVHQSSQGAFDPTVAPLVALFGFGAGAAEEPPSEEARAAAHARLGFRAITWSPNPDAPGGVLHRARNDVTLDLSAIAKGYAVDLVAERLRASGERRFLIEVGGEDFASGTRITGTPWIIGIDEPTFAPPTGPPGSPGRPLHSRLALEDRGIATSGDYRQYRTDGDGRRITHAIDPRVGRPVANSVASVTVIAPTCMRADALATAVMVLGADEGLALLDSIDDVEGLLLLHRDGGGYEELTTRNFAPYRLPSKR